MAFIRKRGGSHQLIETYREHGRIRQRIVANLGPWDDLEQAIEGWHNYVADLSERWWLYQEALDEAKRTIERSDRARAEEGSRPISAHERQQQRFLVGTHVQRAHGMQYRVIQREALHWKRRLDKERANLDALELVVSGSGTSCATN